MKSSKPRVIRSQLVYQGRVFGVRRDHVMEPGGVEATRDVVTHNGSVVVLPVFPDGRILLVHQYRHSVKQYLWELVAGRIEPRETPLAAARRELQEETGYRARRFRRLLDLFPTPGFVSERMIIYSAHGLRSGLARPESDERITSRRFTLQEVERRIKDSTLRDAKSVAAILFYVRFSKT